MPFKRSTTGFVSSKELSPVSPDERALFIENLWGDGANASFLGNVNALTMTAGVADLADPMAVVPHFQAQSEYGNLSGMLGSVTLNDPSVKFHSGGNGDWITYDGGMSYTLRNGSNASGCTGIFLGSAYGTFWRASRKPEIAQTGFRISLGLVGFASHAGNRLRITCGGSAQNSEMPDDGTESGVIAEINAVSNSSFEFRLGVMARGVANWSSVETVSTYFSDGYGVLDLQVTRNREARFRYIPCADDYLAQAVDITMSGVTDNASSPADPNLVSGGYVHLWAKSDETSASNSACGTFKHILIT